MFGYNYHMTLVNADKNIVKLSPTAGTLAKAILPGLVPVVLLTLVAVVAQRNDEPVKSEPVPDLPDYPTV